MSTTTFTDRRTEDSESALELANTTRRRIGDPPIELPRALRAMFLVTSMPVGGAETLLVELVRRLDRKQFSPEIVCLKERGPLGEMLAAEMPVHHDLLTHKFDVRVFPRLVQLFRERKVDCVITVGAGDKMFWGR